MTLELLIGGPGFDALGRLPVVCDDPTDFRTRAKAALGSNATIELELDTDAPRTVLIAAKDVRWIATFAS